MSRLQSTRDEPIELRFIDLFLMIVAALAFVILVLVLRGLGLLSPPSITVRALPPAVINANYDVPLAAVGGSAPLTWRLSQGVLPTGVDLSDGRIRGYAVDTGKFDFSLTVRDAEGREDRRNLTLVVLGSNANAENRPPPMTIEGTAIGLPDGECNTRYAERLEAIGGVGSHRWAVISGTLPRGLILESDGLLSGLPHVERPSLAVAFISSNVALTILKREKGTRRFRVAATDSLGHRETRDVFLYVTPEPFSPLQRLLVGDFLSSDGGWFRGVSLLIRVVAAMVLLLVVFFASLPLLMLALGYPEQRVPGWRGILRRPRPDGNTEVRDLMSPIGAPFAITARKVVNLVKGLWVAGGVVFAAGWGLIRAMTSPKVRKPEASNGQAEDLRHETMHPGDQQPDPKSPFVWNWRDMWKQILDWIFGERESEGRPARGTDPDDLRELPSDYFGGGGAGSGALGSLRGSEGLEPRNQRDYLESLRRGGTVRFGGAFLAVPYVQRIGLDEFLIDAFASLPDVGRGLMHTGLDEFFRHLLALERRRGGPYVSLDTRFDVLMGRRGPYTPPKVRNASAPYANPTGPQGDMVLPAGPAVDRAGCEALSLAMRDSAVGALRALASLRSNRQPSSRSLRTIRHLLRRSAHISLRDGALHVTLQCRSARERRLATDIAVRANEAASHTIGLYRFPLHFVVGPSQRNPAETR